MKIHNLILFLIFLIIGLNIQSGVCYAFFFLIIFVFFIYIFLKQSILYRVVNIDFIPAFFLLVWLYGVGLGLYNKNKIEYIFANNAGMILYALYFILIQINIKKESIYNCLLVSSLTIASITILMYLSNVIGMPEEVTKAIFGSYSGGSSTGQRRVYFIAQVALFPGLCVYVAAFITSKTKRMQYWGSGIANNQKKAIALLLIYILCIIFFTASKGFMLGFLFALFTLPFALFFKSLAAGNINKKVLSFIILVIILLVALISLGYINIITAMFDNNDDANVLRYEQLYYLISDLTVWGKGLGAVIPGYSRNLDKPYGFELSYLSLIHKFGILSIPLVIMYVMTLFKCFKKIANGYNVKYATIAVGAMCYLLPSIGNPLLFAPQAVVLNCLALYMIREDRVYE